VCVLCRLHIFIVCHYGVINDDDGNVLNSATSICSLYCSFGYT